MNNDHGFFFLSNDVCILSHRYSNWACQKQPAKLVRNLHTHILPHDGKWKPNPIILEHWMMTHTNAFTNSRFAFYCKVAIIIFRKENAPLIRCNSCNTTPQENDEFIPLGNLTSYLLLNKEKKLKKMGWLKLKVLIFFLSCSL